MATVWRAVDHTDGTERAIKLLEPSTGRSQKTRKRFLDEAQTMARLHHRNIVRVLEVKTDEDGGHFYFVMELARGGSLADYLRRVGARPPREALALMFQVLQGLDYAHANNVVHRDIKPHNMLLQEPLTVGTRGHDEDTTDELMEQRQVVKLTDFGIARFLHTAARARITGTGDTLGTLAYMSPEQRTDPRFAQRESDVYGVGATLYMMITGRRPFDLAIPGSDPAAMRRMPADVWQIVEKSTENDPAERYGTAREMAGAVALAWGTMEPDRVDHVAMMADFDLAGETIVAPSEG
ncbi:MAG: serine/threonine protein kinase [Myxococcales bacterium]|nr:serine/threonine protein kinase [Myxococcales bacterium]